MITNDKSLGIITDNNLTWSQHVDKVFKKRLQQIYGFYLASKSTLNNSSRVQFLIKTYIQHHKEYCNTVWSGTSQVDLNRIFRLQKRACKIILDYNVENVIVNNG